MNRLGHSPDRIETRAGGGVSTGADPGGIIVRQFGGVA